MNKDHNIDLQRRRTLKTGAALAGVGIVAASPLAALAGANLSTPHSETQDNLAFSKSLDEFTVEVSHRWASNDIALVIRNRGNESATITHITPSKLELARGTIDIDTLLQGGPVTLAAGDELVVPIRHHRRNLNNPEAILSAGHFDRSLQKQLRERISIVTDNNALAAVTVVPGPRIG